MFLKNENFYLMRVPCIGLFFLMCTLVVFACKERSIDDDFGDNILGDTIPKKIFVHPGVLHTEADFIRMRSVVAQKVYPGYASYSVMKTNQTARSDYWLRGPYQYLSSQPQYGNTRGAISMDFTAAHENALMYAVTGDVAHAEKAKEIILAYSSENGLKEIPNVQDAGLLTGMVWGYVYAAEILKYKYEAFTNDNIVQVEGLLRKVFIPAMKNLFYNVPPYTNGNWGAHINSAYMAIGIFLDDLEIYNYAKNFYLHGKDNGNIKNYIDDVGQCQESGRDIPHPQFGIVNLAYTCEMAYKQGDDLYSAYDNRLLKGYEYQVRYNLGFEVPFKRWLDQTGKYSNWNVIATDLRGRLDEILEVAYNHYVVRKGLDMPYTKQALDEIRPEYGGSFMFYEGNSLESDNWGSINDDFALWTHNWWGTSENVRVRPNNGKMEVSFPEGTNRVDIRKGNVVLHAGKHPILAIKLDGIQTPSLTLLSWYGEYGSETGKVEGGIYYFDLRSKPFGQFLFPNDLGVRVNWIQFRISGSFNTKFDVDWIKTFRTKEDLIKFASG